MMNLRQVELEHQLTDLQHSLADLAILSARQEQFQKTCLEELCSLNTEPLTLPQSTQSTSPHPSSAHPRTLFAACPSSLSPTTSPFHSSSHLVAHLPTPRYLPQPHAISPSSHPPPPPTLFIPSAPSPLFGTTSSSQPSSSIAPTTQSFQSFSTSSSAFTLPTSFPLLTPTTPTPTSAAPPSTSASSFSSFGTPASSASQSSPPPSAPFLYTLTPTTPSSTLATSTTTQASFTMPSFVVIPATSPAPNPAATTAPMAAPVTAETQTSTSLVAASTRGTTLNVSTTVFTTPKLPSETRAVVGPSSSLTYTSKNCSNFSSSSVRSSLCSYFRADGLVNTVLVNHVAASRLKGHFQTYNDNRVVPPLGTPTDAMEKLPPKADVLQIAHPIHRPKELDKARRCQVPILYSPLQQAQLHLEFIPHYMTFAMIVFNSYGSRRNILAHEVFDKRQKREIAQKVYPALSLHFPAWWFLKSLFLPRNVQRDIEIILLFQPTFLTGTFGWVSLCFVDSFVNWLHLHFRLGNTSVGQQVLRSEKIFAEKGELMELAQHAHQNGLSLSSMDLQNNGIRQSFTFIRFTNLQLILAVFSALQFFGYIQHTKISVHISFFDILLGEICQHMGILNALGFPLDSKDWEIHFYNLDPIDMLQHTALQASRFTTRSSMVCSTISSNILTIMPNVCLLVSDCYTSVTRTIIRHLEKFANLKWPTDGYFRQEAEAFAVLLRGHIPDPFQIMAESLSLNFQKLISMVLSLAVGTEQIGCSFFSPTLVEIENFYWMIILPKLQSTYATEHPMLMDNELKIFIALWNATLETMILQFCLTLPQFSSAESAVVHSIAINDLDQSQKSKHNILLEQFGARKASLGLAYFNFHHNGITALLQFNLAISFLSSYFLYVLRGHILLWSLSASYKLYLPWMFKAAMSYSGTWCFELIIKRVRSVGIQLDHTIYNHAILGLWTTKSLEQTCTVLYGVLSHFGNVHDIKSWAILFADHSFMVKELLRLAELMQYCVDDANLSDASLLTPRMQLYYWINTKFDDTYLQNVSRYTLKIILGLCSVALSASGSLRPKFFGCITFLDFWKLECLWNARRFGNLAFSPRVYAGTYSATEVKFAQIELVLLCFLYPLPAMVFGLSAFVKPHERLNTILQYVCFLAVALLQRSCMIEVQLGRLGSKFCLGSQFSCGLFGDSHCTGLGGIYHDTFLGPKVWENKQRKPLHANLTA